MSSEKFVFHAASIQHFCSILGVFLLHCFRTPTALLSRSNSIAFGLQLHCFRALKALLLGSESIAFGLQLHSSWVLKALLWLLCNIAA